jgi:hypothetical protein
MTDDTTFNKIEAWLSGELPQAEALAFEAEMASDAALSAEVERHRHGRLALDRLAEQSLQLDFTQWRKSIHDIPSPPPDALPAADNRKKRTGRWLTGGLLLLVAGIIWFMTHPPAQKPPDNGANQENATPTKPDVPVANNTPAVNPGAPNDPGQNKTILPPNNPQISRTDDPQLVALANTRLSGFQDAIRQQYGQTMGDDDVENAFFKAGVKAFLQNPPRGAKKNLLQVPPSDPAYAASQEMLAWLFFQEKNYPEAARRYELYASKNVNPESDWRLVQFYLADYQHHKVDFWKKMDEILDPPSEHRYHQNAQQLKDHLLGLGIHEK